MYETTHYTTDPHFGHARIIELCNRPFKSVDEMNETMIENFNEAAPDKTHRLFIIGDACMGKLEDSLKCIASLSAYTILIPGNHDRPSRAYTNNAEKRQREYARYREVFDEVWEEPDEGSSVWKHPDLTYADGWPVWMSHYPSAGDSHGKDRHHELRPRPEQYPLIHGHVHNEWRTRGAQFNAGVDVNDFKPVHEDTIKEWLTTLA